MFRWSTIVPASHVLQLIRLPFVTADQGDRKSRIAVTLLLQ